VFYRSLTVLGSLHLPVIIKVLSYLILLGSKQQCKVTQ